MGYIEKVAIDWSEKEIDTIEKVDKYMSRHKDYSKIMGYYGVDRRPTEKEEKLIRIWLDEYKTNYCLRIILCQNFTHCSLCHFNKLFNFFIICH